MFTGSTKLPPAKTPQPERLDEVYAALRRGLQLVNASSASASSLAAGRLPGETPLSTQR